MNPLRQITEHTACNRVSGLQESSIPQTGTFQLRSGEKERSSRAIMVKHPSLPDPAEIAIPLLEQLRQLRKQVAKEKGIPTHTVFRDHLLREMSEIYPQSEEEMINLVGVSEKKMKLFGHGFLDLIRKQKAPAERPKGILEACLNKERLLSYLEEMRTKRLRFNAMIIAGILTGTDTLHNGALASKVSFRGLLMGVIGNKEVYHRIRDFYKPYEAALADEQRNSFSNSDLRKQQRWQRSMSYFNGRLIDSLNIPDIIDLKNKINTLPAGNADDMIPEALRELRQLYPRAEEPIGKEEEELLEYAIKHCSDLFLLTRLFGRTEKEIISISNKWLEELPVNHC